MGYLETILKEFPIDTSSPREIPLTETQESTRFYKINQDKSPLLTGIEGDIYLIDTPSARKTACHPHIVAETLSELCYETAKELKKALSELGLLSDNSGLLHILRGSSGYMLDKALPSLPLINIRTEYNEDGYRSHSDDSRRISVTYSDYKATDFDTLIVPDTYATGRSVETALRFMFEKGFDVGRVILYGFIAAPGLERVYRLLEKHDVELIVVAICDITQLYSNNYDMPLYGIDEHLYKETGQVRPLGSIVSIETLSDMIPYYIPGMDQPGDWSERHTNLFNGYTEESGDIEDHLDKSLHLIKSLDELNSKQDWYTEQVKRITEREIENIQNLRNDLYA